MTLNTKLASQSFVGFMHNGKTRGDISCADQGGMMVSGAYLIVRWRYDIVAAQGSRKPTIRSVQPLRPLTILAILAAKDDFKLW